MAKELTDQEAIELAALCLSQCVGILTLREMPEPWRSIIRQAEAAISEDRVNQHYELWESSQIRFEPDYTPVF